jgi:8-oxo-dGTP pyrophosphatase MutT (NUDIX family)
MLEVRSSLGCVNPLRVPQRQKESKALISVASPRPAASLLVVRFAAGRGGEQVLMGRRGAGHRFMPNVLVFPGGAADADDHDARAATPLMAHVRARLERSAEPSLAHALGIAACRELREEVGLSLGEPPALGRLEYLCRAVTPPDRPIRFDARFFIADARHVSGEPAASEEIEDPAWYTIEQARQGPLAAATRAVLDQFERWLALSVRDGPVPVMKNRIWSEE